MIGYFIPPEPPFPEYSIYESETPGEHYIIHYEYPQFVARSSNFRGDKEKWLMTQREQYLSVPITYNEDLYLVTPLLTSGDIKVLKETNLDKVMEVMRAMAEVYRELFRRIDR